MNRISRKERETAGKKLRARRRDLLGLTSGRADG